jgi:ABC-type tungstate transport system substrate-binding protein
MQKAWREYGDALRVDDASRLRVIEMIGRPPVLRAVLAGFGRTISEVGAILIVGGGDIGRKTRLPAKLLAAIGAYTIANEQLFHPPAASPK